jgi:DNA topoisomerase-2
MDLSKYRKHTHREHILALPDTYIGSIENAEEDVYVVNLDEDGFCKKSLEFNSGFYKLFDELLVNANDHAIRMRNSRNPVNHIDVSMEDNTIRIRNNGESIDIAKHPEYGVYIPQLIFGELLTSTNYDKDEKKLVGGKNGYGVKLVNIFAKIFQVEIVDATRKLKYTQVFRDNMTLVGAPVVTASKDASYVCVEWTPDLARFGWTAIPDGMVEVLRRRVYDLALTAGRDVRVTWNGTPIKFRDLASYASWYLPENAAVVADSYVGWQVAVADAPDKFMNVSFVNGIWTRSGKHVDEITNQIVAHFVSYFEKKKVKVRPSLVKDALSVFILCSIENPSFSSQTKEVMTSKVSCKLSEEFLKKLVSKLAIVDSVMESQALKDMKEASKTDGKKHARISVPKLDDATLAGTSRSHECTLILTEGDSAKSMALSGLTQDQRKTFGVFPLRGKLLNVKDVSASKVGTTEEIVNLKKILGLESGKTYDTLKSLRYGRVLIMTDQDYDGSHIRGLLVNVFHELWHELIEIPGFLAYMATPIVKATKGKQTLNFYTQYEYEQWRADPGAGKWHVKYYKGLGTSTRDEAKEYFKVPKMVPYSYTGSISDHALELAFNKSMANNRKAWLQDYDASAIVSAVDELPYEDFVNLDLIHFSNYNLERAIPSVMDGLKTSQRKILFAAFKRNLKDEIRVAQFAGYVSEHSGYHHGEASLNDTIVGMAQDFVGSNNLPWFVPQGQFGTRLQGGKDSASPRYIHTYLQPYVRALVPKEDFGCLVYRDDDGLPVEPHWYAPILPMLLVNGCRGIGTGYSTFIPCYNPADLKRVILRWLKTGTGLDEELTPYYRGFTGTIVRDGADFIHRGVRKGKEITELPIGTWTEDFREALDKSGVEYADTSTDTHIHIVAKEVPDKLMEGKLKLTNMHAFNHKGVIHKYATPNEILEEYCAVRLELYETRRQTTLRALRDKLPYHENVVRFIREQCADPPHPDLRKKTMEECHALLDAEGFDEIDGYDYLMNLPMASLTSKHAKKHEKDLMDLEAEIVRLEATTARELWKVELDGL